MTLQDFLQKTGKFFRSPFFLNFRTPALIWLLIAVVLVLVKFHADPERVNNFLIYRSSFLHLLEGKSLYAFYPEEYFDHNLYGPVFAVLMAPFAAVPPLAGLLLWEITLAAGLFWAIHSLPMARDRRIVMLWYVTNEVVASLMMAQFNMAIAAMLMATFVAVRRGKPVWAAFFIMLGTMTKIYGIVGLIFFFFIRRKWRFIGWLGLWGAVFFVLPMIFSSPQYVVSQYGEWMVTLGAKNELNTVGAATIDLSFHQNVSFLGMAHRISGLEFSDMYILVPAAVLTVAPLLRRSQWRHVGFQYGFLASVLMALILFSTGSESSGYVLALSGVAIWYLSAPWKRGGWALALLWFALILGSFGVSDLMPKYLRNEWIRPYVLKALPIILVWAELIREMLTRDYSGEGEYVGGEACHFTGRADLRSTI